MLETDVVVISIATVKKKLGLAPWKGRADSTFAKVHHAADGFF